MSLDIAILGANGSPEKQISIGADEHERLMKIVPHAGLLRRLRDYYADAEFRPQELPLLAEEAAALARSCQADSTLSLFLGDLNSLAIVAWRKGTSLVAIAD